MSSKIKNFYRTIVPSTKNALYLFISFCASLSLWLSVTTQEVVTSSYSVRIDTMGLPQNLIVTEGMVDTLSVRLRGSAEFFSTLNSRDLVYALDLSTLTEGASVISLDLSDEATYDSFDVLSVEPSQLVIVCEEILSKEVPLEALLVENTAIAEYLIKDISLLPKNIKLRGAESVVSKISRVVAPLSPSISKGEGRHIDSVALIVPEGTEAIPPVVDVAYTLEARTIK